ncbi:hypothetical protein OV203_42275 [Nannocystis sp. ILAH1]|uniref:hypothetical protein n=1 Tax=Nannocystis sp. ILAH1 TaxID=2996789 RepID=UPI002272087A|nr:hypothetical protein [Nannocystis sp. ILAH1]MCY0993841.1 hypothetical protein [Nannocystis sp. ILAH1]
MTDRPVACRRPAALGLMLAAVIAACSGVDEPGELGLLPQESGEPAAASRLAQIRVVVQPPGEFGGDEPALEVAAVFAQYRGYDEAAARTRLDLPRPPAERLRAGHCVPSDQLLAGDEPVSKDTVSKDSSGARELILLDAGNLSLGLGDAAIDVPLALLPDLVPTISGVTYDYLGDSLPAGAWPPGEPAPSELVIRVDGEGDELPGFTLRPRLPEPALLSGAIDRDRDELRLEWRPDGREPLILRLVSLIGGEPVGEELTCVARDDGSFVADLDELHALGLDGGPGTALRASATRSDRTVFDAGEFVGAEAVVEVRTVTVIGG